MPLPLDPGLRGHPIELIESERQRVNFMDLIAGQEIGAAEQVFPAATHSLDQRDRRDMAQPGTTIAWCRAQKLPLAPMPDQATPLR